MQENKNKTLQLDDISKEFFLDYAAAVIKSRALPMVEDGLKPVHRRILFSMYENKFFSDKSFVKSARIVGEVMGKYHPHGDSSIYEALVRLSQWWNLRYPVVLGHGNFGNLLGDSAAAARYTEAKLSPVGEMLLEGLKENCVDFKPNYDNTTEEPLFLPSRFPFILCGNSMGIAVGMSGDMVSHNFTEVAGAITYYLNNKDTCTVADLMKFIQGPDFPTGGRILNGEDLLNIYSTGRGSVKVESHYDIVKKGQKTQLIFHDLPYGVNIDGGVKEPLKKLVIEDGYSVFEDIEVVKAGPRNFDITITLAKNADVKECLKILFAKTRLASTIKINQTVIVNNNPRTLSLLELIKYWVDYRSNIIKRIGQDDYQKTDHKLTVVIGLQKCMSDIDKLISLIRESASRAAAKIAIMNEFELNEEQADAVLDMKLSRLSKLELTELNDERDKLEKHLARCQEIIGNENVRFKMIEEDLAAIKKIIGKDERITEIVYTRPIENVNSDKPIVKNEFNIYPEGLRSISIAAENDLVDTVFAYTPEDIFVYNHQGEMCPVEKAAIRDAIGAFTIDDQKKNKLVSVTEGGNIKVSVVSEYKMNKLEKVMKVKDDDRMIFAALCSDDDYVMLWNGEKVLKLLVSELTVASKSTVGVKSGLEHIVNAMVVNDKDLVLMVGEDGKGKFTSVKDFSIDSRGNKGQSVADGTKWIVYFNNSRENFFAIPKQGKPLVVSREKLSIKGKNAVGALITSRALINVI